MRAGARNLNRRRRRPIGPPRMYVLRRSGFQSPSSPAWASTYGPTKPNPTREGKRRSESFTMDFPARLAGETPPPLRFSNTHIPVSSTDPQKIPNCRRNPSSGATARSDTSSGGIGGGSFPAPHLGGCAARPVPVASFLRLHLQDFAPLSSEGFALSSYLCAHV